MSIWRTILILMFVLTPWSARGDSLADLDGVLKRLASEEFAQREAAQAELEKLPPEHMRALREISEGIKDAEVKARVERGLVQIAMENLRTLAQTKPPEMAAKIAGKVVSADGKPLKGIRVSARSAAMGSELWSALVWGSNTDEQGRFEIGVPFPDVHYALFAGPVGFESQVRSALGGEILTTPVALTRTTHDIRTVNGTLIDGNDKPLADHAFELVGEYQTYKAKTGAKGAFSVALDGPYLGQGIILARSGDEAAPIQIIRDPSLTGKKAVNVELRLRPAAAIAGVVRCNGAPVANATVRVRPNFSSGVRFSVRTDKSGGYEITGIPAGSYLVTAESAAHTCPPPRGEEYNIPATTLQAGKYTTVDLDVEPVGAVMGQVLDAAGKPAADALVAIIANWRDSNEEKWVCRWTDKDGRFLLGTGRANQSLTVYAFTSADGLGHATLSPTGLGTLREVTIRLPGAMRVKGRVTDPEGRALRDVRCFVVSGVQVTTDAGGDFDLGRVSLVRGEDGKAVPQRVSFAPPRPQRGRRYAVYGGYEGLAHPVASREKAPTFYHRREATPTAATASAMDVKLAPAALLEIVGTVQDRDGKPAAKAQVHLFAGAANPDTWLNTARPRLRGSLNIVVDSLLDATDTDAEGKFRFWTVRYDNGGTPSMPGVDWSKYSLGASTESDAVLERGVVVPKDTERIEVNLRFGAAATSQPK